MTKGNDNTTFILVMTVEIPMKGQKKDIEMLEIDIFFRFHIIWSYTTKIHARSNWAGHNIFSLLKKTTRNVNIILIHGA